MESSLLNSLPLSVTNQSLFLEFTSHEMPFYMRHPLAKKKDRARSAFLMPLYIKCKPRYNNFKSCVVCDAFVS
jgi:hypothetical protein